DAADRVTGRAIYPADFTRPGMVHGHIVRSPHAHARILGIDTTKAAAMPGVLAIVTAADFTALSPGASVPMGDTGQEIWSISLANMARDKAYWIGHPVAAVAAADRQVAAAAAAAIEVRYEALAAVMSIDASLAPGAPVLHEGHVAKGLDLAPGEKPQPSNVGTRTLITRGDATAALAVAPVRASIDATVDTAHQGYIEPCAVVAEVDAAGMVTVWASTQGQFSMEMQLAAMLALPQSKIRVVPLEIGGGFGGKIATHIEPAAVLLARKCGRPVKIVMSRTEVMHGTGPAAAARIAIEVGADRDGRLTAISGHYRLDAGGIPGTPTTLLMQASAALYQAHAPALKLEGIDVTTNKPKTEAYRGPGGIQAAFAVEQAMDELSIRLDIDPLELRRRNASVTGSLMPIGTPFPSIGLTTILDRVAAHACWREPLGKGRFPRGRGLALGYWRGTSMTSAAHVTIGADGRPMVTMGSVDISGTRTAMAQVAAEEFQLAIDDVHIQMGDTKSVPYSDPAAGSRVGRTMTAAVAEACRDALAEMRRRAGEKLQCPPTEVRYTKGVFTRGDSGASITIAELMRQTTGDGAIIGRGVSTRLPLGVEVGAQVADVEVDTATGQVTVLRFTAFQDVGRALNPPAVEGQIEGSVVQGLGWALTEGFDYDASGRLRNASLLDYRIPTALDVPPIEVVLIETPVPGVPYGVRGVGEIPIVPPAAAVGNAIRRAIGRRLTHMPMTPERVVAALSRLAAE
ncbi:MAG TPA: xanthine dehydrogenase family protein molybdopterin-binding subunit, partial [Hyphomicrobiaceae bacterium]|nr:xanthine dehydrogenase family protein molybdopterin-binding subunit [Hyphomicrobiaceae bacterium]